MKKLLYTVLFISVSYQQMPASILFKEDFESGWAQWDKDILKAEIVACSGDRSSKCMRLTEKVDGGGVFTLPITNPQAQASFTGKIWCEFKYHAINYEGKPFNSSLVMGYTNGKRTQYVWAAAGDPSNKLIQSTFSSVSMLQIVDEVDVWKLVRIEVSAPDSMITGDPTLVIVFEDWNGIDSKLGSYEIDDVVVYSGTLCPEGCVSCQDYQTCDACDEGLVAVNGAICLSQDDCLDSLINLQETDVVVKFKPTTNDQYTFNLDITVGTYSFPNCFTTTISAVSSNDLLIEDLSFTNPTDTTLRAPVDIRTQCEKLDATHYDCYFKLLISTSSTTLLAKTFNQKIKFQASGSPVATYTAKTFKVDTLPPISINVQADAVSCAIVKTTQTDCSNQPANPTISVGDSFMVTLTISDNQFQNYKLTGGLVYFQGVGTLVVLEIKQVYAGTGTISYKVVMSLVPDENDVVVVTAELQAPASRMLKAQTLRKKYAPSAQLKLTVAPNPSAIASESIDSQDQTTSQTILCIVVGLFVMIIF